MRRCSLLLLACSVFACADTPVRPLATWNNQWQASMTFDDGRRLDFVLDVFQTPITARHGDGRVFLQLHTAVDGKPVVFGGLGGAAWRRDPRDPTITFDDPSQEWVDLLVVDAAGDAVDPD